jgi:hypothetical protein
MSRESQLIALKLEAKEIQAEALDLHSGGGEDKVDLTDKFREVRSPEIPSYGQF